MTNFQNIFNPNSNPISGTPLEYIYHEKQLANLCAQHCLNNVLQGPYFKPFDLGTVAHQLDEEEAKMTGVSLTESHNVDDSGNFSIQVVFRCLASMNVSAHHMDSMDAKTLRSDLKSQRAFIFHLPTASHFSCLRRFREWWVELDSLAKWPKVMTDNYLEIFLETMAQRGYSIFILGGTFPKTTADTIEAFNTPPPISLINKLNAKPKNTGLGNLGLSPQELAFISTGSHNQPEEEDDELMAAIAMSLSVHNTPATSTTIPPKPVITKEPTPDPSEKRYSFTVLWDPPSS